MSSIEKSIKILNYLSEIERSVGITELSAQLSFPKSTIHRILNTLSKYSLVTQEEETSKYKLGLQVVKYSNSFYNSFDFRQIAKPILKEICWETKLTTFLTIWYNSKGICIDSITPSFDTNTHLFVEIGKKMPFHCAASAKVLLAYRQPKEINSIINKKNLHKYTSKTITDPQELENHLKQIKDKGFAFCDEELEEGAKAISAPIKNINREVVASITITGLSRRISKNNIGKLTAILLDASQKLSEMLGHKKEKYLY
ncbi:MAG TPA: IclR family transcriptional regulator [Candidatus Atribacteria bacterium]|nr:IclR family transcriptional regulator [Candidatus Atribacteria bacterium]